MNPVLANEESCSYGCLVKCRVCQEMDSKQSGGGSLVVVPTFHHSGTQMQYPHKAQPVIDHPVLSHLQRKKVVFKESDSIPTARLIQGSVISLD